MSWRTGRPVRAVGGGALALALLVCAGVFAAVAGPAESLHLRTRALQQTLAPLGVTAKSVVASDTLSDFLGGIDGGNGPNGNGGTVGALKPAMLEQSQQELRAGFAQTPLPLTNGDWAGLTSKSVQLQSGYAPSARAGAQNPPQATLVYRDSLTSNASLIAGGFAPKKRQPAGTIAVSVAPATAARFGVRPGSVLTLGTGVRLLITGIFRPQGVGSDFWQSDVGMLTPSPPGGGPKGPSYWLGEFVVDPGALAALAVLPAATLVVQWEYPLDVSRFNADQVGTLDARLNQVVATMPQLSGPMAAAAGNVTVTTSLQQPLQEFLDVQTSVLAVLLVLFVSLAVTGGAVIVLAGRMIVDRREEELVMLRARGASAGQVGLLLARGSALVVVPAAAAGVALAAGLVPGAGSAPGGSAVLGWALAVATVLLALGCAPVTAMWRHRRPGPAANPARITSADTGRSWLRGPGLRRLVIEVTAGGGAIAGLVVLHGQGVPSAGSTNWFLTTAPALAAILAVIVVLRIYPLVIGLALRIARRRAGATGYIALASSARASLATSAPAFALILALTLGAFAGMVTQGINNGQDDASWQATGADAVVSTGVNAVPITPAVQHTLAALPGVQHEAAVWNTNWTAANGQAIAVTAASPAQYAALNAATPFPAIPAGALTTAPSPPGTTTVINVLASPQAAAALGTGPVQLSSVEAMGPITVRITGVLAATPAQTAGGPFLVMPLQQLPGALGKPVLNVALLTGTGIDRARLDADVARLLPESSITYRADALAGLRNSPLQSSAEHLMLLTTIAAAAFGLLNLILGLALGAPSRELAAARLAVMGHHHPGTLAIVQTLPAVLAAAIGGLACALTLPAVTGNALDLSVFTNSTAAVTMRPDLLTLGLPAAIMILLAILTLAAHTQLTRDRHTSNLLRAS